MLVVLAKPYISQGNATVHAGLLLWYCSCPKPTHASTNSLEESGKMSKILHCT